LAVWCEQPERAAASPASVASEIVTWESAGVDLAGWHASLAYQREGGDWVSLAKRLPPTGSYRWDTEGLPSDANYTLRVRVVDDHGREVAATVEGLTLGANAPPTVRLIAPGAGAIFESQVGVLWETSDPDDDPLRISIDYSSNGGLAWLPVVEDARDTGYFEWYVAFLPPGRAYRVRVTVSDGQHVARAASGVFGIGPLPEPRLRLLAPVAAQQVCGYTIVRWRTEVLRAYTLKASVLIRRAGDSGWQTLATNIPNDGHYVWNTMNLRDGYYDLRVSVTDGLHTVTDALSEPVCVRNHGGIEPYLAITEPWLSGPWFGIRELQWCLWPPSKEAMTGTLLVRGAGEIGWRTIATVEPQRGRWLLDARRLADVGAAELTLRVSSAGLETQATVGESFLLGHYEQLPPMLDVYMLPEHDLSPGDRVLAWHSVGWSGEPLVAELWRTTDDVAQPETVASGASRGTYWFTKEDAVADHGGALGVTVSDGFFRVRALPVSVAELLPGEEPLPDLDVNTPVSGQVVSGSLTVTWSVPGGGQDASVVLGVSSDGGQTWRRLAEVPAELGAYLWDSTRVPNGPCWLKASLEWEGQTGNHIVPVTVQNDVGHAPVVSLSMPDTDVPWAGPRRIAWVSHDADGDELSINLAYSINKGRTWYVFARGLDDTGSYLLDTSLLPNADKVYLRITAFDGTYRTSAIGNVAIMVRDPSRPLVELKAPHPGETCFGLEEIEWVGQDPARRGAVEVRLEISDDGGATWQEIANGLELSGSAMWNTRDVPNGDMVLLRVVATEGDQVLALDTIDGPVYVRGNPNAPSLPLPLP